jgi:ribonuclease HI
MATKKKYYVVLKGREKGVFDTWAECKLQIDNFPGAAYKSFESEAEAHTALKKGYFPQSEAALKKQKEAASRPFIKESISVDAACSGNPGMTEYQGVDNRSGKRIFHKGPFLGNNNLGEFLAIVHALALLKQHNINMPIYSDSVTAMSWVRNKVIKSELSRDQTTKEVWDLADRALKWLKENTYTNPVLKWETTEWGENTADFGRK